MKILTFFCMSGKKHHISLSSKAEGDGQCFSRVLLCKLEEQWPDGPLYTKSQAWYTSGTPAQEGSDPACLVKVAGSRFSQRPCHKTKVDSERSKAQDLHMLTHRQVHTQTHTHTHHYTHRRLHSERCIRWFVSVCEKSHYVLSLEPDTSLMQFRAKINVNCLRLLGKYSRCLSTHAL